MGPDPFFDCRELKGTGEGGAGGEEGSGGEDGAAGEDGREGELWAFRGGGGMAVVGAVDLIAFAADPGLGGVKALELGGENGEGVGADEGAAVGGFGFEAGGVGDGHAREFRGGAGGAGDGDVAGGEADAEDAEGEAFAEFGAVLAGEVMDVAGEGVGVGGVVEEEEDAVAGAADDLVGGGVGQGGRARRS